jgi:hypothetical protein
MKIEYTGIGSKFASSFSLFPKIDLTIFKSKFKVISMGWLLFNWRIEFGTKSK